MKRPTEKPEDWFRRNFPSAEARRKADEAVDRLDVTLPMTEFIDTWIRVYNEVAPRKGLT